MACVITLAPSSLSWSRMLLRPFVILAFPSMGKWVDVSLSVDSPVSTLWSGEAFYSHWIEGELLQMHAASKCLKIQLIKLVRNCRACRACINREAFQAGCCSSWQRGFLKGPLFTAMTYFTVRCHRVILFSCELHI